MHVAHQNPMHLAHQNNMTKRVSEPDGSAVGKGFKPKKTFIRWLDKPAWCILHGNLDPPHTSLIDLTRHWACQQVSDDLACYVGSLVAVVGGIQISAFHRLSLPIVKLLSYFNTHLLNRAPKSIASNLVDRDQKWCPKILVSLSHYIPKILT